MRSLPAVSQCFPHARSQCRVHAAAAARRLVLHAQPAFLATPPQGSEDSDVTRPQMYVNKGIMPLLDIGGVDLVLSGHSHSYERSMLIRGCVGGARRLLTTALPQQGATRSVARRMRRAHGPSGVLGRAPLPPSLRCACGVRTRLVECPVELVPPPLHPSCTAGRLYQNTSFWNPKDMLVDDGLGTVGPDGKGFRYHKPPGLT
jgi:hypothetical protein